MYGVLDTIRIPALHLDALTAPDPGRLRTFHSGHICEFLVIDLLYLADYRRSKKQCETEISGLCCGTSLQPLEMQEESEKTP